MQLHELKAAKGSRKRRKIIGRGRASGHGKTSTRGQKGAMSRAGHWVVGASEGGQMPLIRRLPKIGFNSKRPILNQIVSLDDLNHFENGAIVNLQTLKSKGLINSLNKPFKVLGNGELKKALTFQITSICVSASAQEKIKKAGGKIEIIDNSATPETKKVSKVTKAKSK
jgi:large subunit ribosomal protein L15